MNITTFKKTCLPYYANFYRKAYRMLEDREEAEDVVQEVFEKLWNSRNKLEEIKNIEAYGITLTRNLCLDRLRSSRYRHLLEKKKDETNGKEDDTEASDELRFILGLVSELPDNQNKVFKLHYFKELTIAEIEQVTKIKTGNIRVLLSRAKSKILEQYNKYYKSLEKQK